MTTELRSIGDKIAGARAAANTAVTAGGAGDNTLVTGDIIDLAAYGWPESAVLMIPWVTTLAAAATLTIGGVVQTGPDDALASVRTLQTITGAVVRTGAVTGGKGMREVNVSLRGADRYLRGNFTPDLSAANTDTAALSAVWVFGGAERLPV